MISILEVLEVDAKGRKKYKCKCDCGKELNIYHSNLTRRKNSSCGCDRLNIKFNYLIPYWRSLQNRVREKSDDAKYYFDRGIENRFTSFESFASYIDNNLGRPQIGDTLERIENNKSYEPGNIKWATRKEQAINRRPRAGKSSTYRGVSKIGNRWKAQLAVNGKMLYLGLFKEELKAYKTYLIAYFRLHKDLPVGA